MADKQRKEIKCEGRFHELREDIALALEMLVAEYPDYRIVNRPSLNQIFEMVEEDIPRMDLADPYFLNRRDFLRTDPSFIGGDGEDPENKGLALVPLITPDTELTRGLKIGSILHYQYASRFTNDDKLLDKLLHFAGDRDYATEGMERLDLEIGLKMANLRVPLNGNGNGHGNGNGNGNGHAHNYTEYGNLAGYKLAAGFAIGPNAFGTLVYDAPYHIELHVLDPRLPQKTERTKESGVMGIGFWLNKDKEMLVAQIQQMRGEHLPKGMEHGITGLCIAEAVAKALDLERVTTYSHHSHPQFVMHPDSKSQMEGMFRRDYDHAARVLNYTPLTRNDGTGNAVNVGFTKQL